MIWLYAFGVGSIFALAIGLMLRAISKMLDQSDYIKELQYENSELATVLGEIVEEDPCNAIQGVCYAHPFSGSGGYCPYRSARLLLGLKEPESVVEGGSDV